jgi:hypothetical protein
LTATITPTTTPTLTMTDIITPTITPTSSTITTPTITPSEAISLTATITPTTTPTLTMTDIITPTITPTSSNTAIQTGSISGTISLPDSDFSGMNLLVIAATTIPGSFGSQFVFQKTLGSETSLTYEISNVPVNDYYVICILPQPERFMPTNTCMGVYGTYYPTFPSSANCHVTNGVTTTADINVSYASYKLRGDIYLPGSDSVSDATLKVSEGFSPQDLSEGNEFEIRINGYEANVTGNRFSYDFILLFPGIVYIEAFVDKNDNDIIDAGDYTGMQMLDIGNTVHDITLDLQLTYVGAMPSATITPTVTATPTATTITSGTINGTLTFPSVISGKSYQIFVEKNLLDIAYGNVTNQIQGIINDTNTVPYSLTAPADTYYVCAATGGPNGPDFGDYIGVYGAVYPDFPSYNNVTVTVGQVTDNIDISAAIVSDSNSVSGTITLESSVASDSNYYVFITVNEFTFQNGNFNPGQGIIGFSQGVINNGENSIDYLLPLFFPWSYYINVFVDADGDGSIGAGDYTGSHATGSISPKNNNSGHDFTASMR